MMHTNEAAVKMIGGAVGMHYDAKYRWHIDRFQRQGPESHDTVWYDHAHLPVYGKWTIEADKPVPPGRVVRLAVERKKEYFDGLPYVAVTPGNWQEITELNPDHVVGYVWTLPDGRELVPERALGVVWTWPDAHGWDYSLLAGASEMPGARPAKLTHVLWWEAGDELQ